MVLTHGNVKANEHLNSLRKTLGHLNILQKYFELKGNPREIHNIPPTEFGSLLANILLSVEALKATQKDLKARGRGNNP